MAHALPMILSATVAALCSRNRTMADSNVRPHLLQVLDGECQ